MTNPSFATVTRIDGTPDVDSFRLKYLLAGQVVAELVVPANYVTGNQYVQSLHDLNALVAPQFQGAELTLTASAINAGGESTATVSPTQVVIVNAPAAPASVDVS
jgi:hypothetical protein